MQVKTRINTEKLVWLLFYVTLLADACISHSSESSDSLAHVALLCMMSSYCKVAQVQLIVLIMLVMSTSCDFHEGCATFIYVSHSSN